jgi:hypothetical protein
MGKDPGDATRISLQPVNLREMGRNLLSLADTPMTPPSNDEIRSEARGPHWIAWVSRNGDPKPHRSVVLVGQTQEEAEANARKWAAS